MVYPKQLYVQPYSIPHLIVWQTAEKISTPTLSLRHHTSSEHLNEAFGEVRS